MSLSIQQKQNLDLALKCRANFWQNNKTYFVGLDSKVISINKKEFDYAMKHKNYDNNMVKQ